MSKYHCHIIFVNKDPFQRSAYDMVNHIKFTTFDFFKGVAHPYFGYNLYDHFPQLFLSHALTQAMPKQKRVNFRTNHESNDDRSLQKRLEMNWVPGTLPENGPSNFDFIPLNLDGITPELQMDLLQLLLRMKSQGARILEVTMDMVINFKFYHFEIFIFRTSEYIS